MYERECLCECQGRGRGDTKVNKMQTSALATTRLSEFAAKRSRRRLTNRQGLFLKTQGEVEVTEWRQNELSVSTPVRYRGNFLLEKNELINKTSELLVV